MRPRGLAGGGGRAGRTEEVEAKGDEVVVRDEGEEDGVREEGVLEELNETLSKQKVVRAEQEIPTRSCDA